MKYIIDMPDGWTPKPKGSRDCPEGCIMENDCLWAYGEFDPINYDCPLSSALVAYEVTGNHLQEYVDGRPVKLYATMEDK